MIFKLIRRLDLIKVFGFIIVSLLSFSHCSEKKPTEPVEEEEYNFISDAITIGKITEEHSEDISSSGGTVTVSNPQSSINGLSITIPPNGYQETRNFSVSTANVSSHKFGENFNPISPLIIIQNGGGYSATPMTIKVPIENVEGEFPVVFFYDEISGAIEVLPVLSVDETSITVETSHFELSNLSSENNLKKSNARGVIGNLIISSIKESILLSQTVLSSGFTPGVDDWEFINFGSYISPGGHCAGQSMTAMWYYYEKKLKGEPPLFHLFDEINESNNPEYYWFDNPLGYRFASTIQEDFKFGDWVKLVDLESRHPKLTYLTFIAAMLITGEPQFVIIKKSTGAKVSGHAMIIYKISVTEGKLYVADPNYPNNRTRDGNESLRTITFSNEKFTPYPSYAKVGDPGIEFDQIAIFGKTANIKWSQITKRFEELNEETIGNDRFPSYELNAMLESGEVPLTDNMKVHKDTLKVYCRNTNISEFMTGTDHRQIIFVFDKDSYFIAESHSDGIAYIDLNPGENHLGFYINGKKNGIGEYYDFRWITVNYEEPTPGDDEILQSNRCIVKVHFNGHYKQINQDNETSEFDQEDYWGQFAATGSFSGKSFVGNYNETLGSSNYTGSVVINLNEDNSMVTSVDWTEDYTSYWQSNVDATSTSSFGGNDIPKSPSYPGVYQLNGEQTCNHLSIVQYSYQNMSTSINQTLESHICNEYSYITITLYKE